MTRMLLVALFVANLSAALPAAGQVACPAADTIGNPVIEAQHIFCGEVSLSRGQFKAKGFHSRPGGVNPVTITVIGGVTTPARLPAGIYLLNNFDITDNGITKRKTVSTMFPDACSETDVVAAIESAAGPNPSPNIQFRGFSGPTCLAGAPLQPFKIVGFTDAQGRVRTAWPDY